MDKLCSCSGYFGRARTQEASCGFVRFEMLVREAATEFRKMWAGDVNFLNIRVYLAFKSIEPGNFLYQITVCKEEVGRPSPEL